MGKFNLSAAIKRIKLAVNGLIWETTKTNVLGWAVERQNRITRRWQHIRYDRDGKWQPGKL